MHTDKLFIYFLKIGCLEIMKPRIRSNEIMEWLGNHNSHLGIIKLLIKKIHGVGNDMK